MSDKETMMAMLDERSRRLEAEQEARKAAGGVNRWLTLDSFTEYVIVSHIRSRADEADDDDVSDALNILATEIETGVHHEDEPAADFKPFEPTEDPF